MNHDPGMFSGLAGRPPDPFLAAPIVSDSGQRMYGEYREAEAPFPIRHVIFGPAKESA